MLIPRFFNWIECTFEEYERSCLKYGYNCESSPAFIKFMLQLGAPLRFFSYKVKGNLVGSICVDQGWIANDIKNKKKSIGTLPVPKCAILLPFSSEINKKILLPFHSKCLHPLQRNLFLNSSYSLFSKRQIAISKDLNTEFSKKTIATRDRELRKFHRSGGSFKLISEMDGNTIFDIYSELYYARRLNRIEDEEINKEFFIKFHSCFKGEVMLIDDEPVAIQLLLSVDNVAGFFVDFINIGYKQNDNIPSLGTIMMWKNLISLTTESQSNGKKLYYSYGFMSGEYKKRWCNPHRTGRVLI